jgi:hypothetical protein
VTTYAVVTPATTPVNKKDTINVTGLEFIKFVNDMSTAHQVAISIPTAWAAWKALLLTYRWKTQNEARADPQFQEEFMKRVQE